MKKEKKHSDLRVRRVNKTDRDTLGTQVIKNKKKEASKNWCRKTKNPR